MNVLMLIHCLCHTKTDDAFIVKKWSTRVKFQALNRLAINIVCKGVLDYLYIVIMMSFSCLQWCDLCAHSASEDHLRWELRTLLIWFNGGIQDGLLLLQVEDEAEFWQRQTWGPGQTKQCVVQVHSITAQAPVMGGTWEKTKMVRHLEELMWGCRLFSMSLQPKTSVEPVSKRWTWNMS